MAQIVSERRHDATQLVGLIIADGCFVGVAAWLLVNASRGPNLMMIALVEAIVAAPLLFVFALATIDAARSLNPLRRARVTFDPEKRIVVFEECRVAKTFWSFGSAPRLECPFDDILDIREQGGRAPAIKVVTTHGVVMIDSGFPEFPELRAAFAELRGQVPGGSIVEAFWFPFLLAVVIVAAIFSFLIVFRWI